MKQMLKRLFYLPLLTLLRWKQSSLIVQIEDAQHDLWFACENLTQEAQNNRAKKLESLLETQADVEAKICQFWSTH
ncbi:MAG: hypothetical protein RR740_00545 [Pseudomonas sp.]